jgi:tRNA-dihydrouridine synthase A
MQDKVGIPVTVKCRIGVDQYDRYCDLRRFVEQVSQAGCTTFIVHARKAWLKGMSPKQNREIPPLQYEVVYQLKQEFSKLEIIVNGGICTLAEVENHLVHTDGVMVGREAYRNPVMLNSVDRQLFGSLLPQRTRLQVLDRYKRYIVGELDQGTPLQHMTRHLLGFFQGEPGARAWRRHLSCYAPRQGAGLEVVYEAEALVRRAMKLSEVADVGEPVIL